MIRLVGRDGQPFATYLCIGGASALTEWSAFWLLLKTPLHYTAAAAVAFIVATCVNYLLCVRTVFVSKTRSGWKDLAMVFAASLLAVTLNILVMVQLIDHYGVGVMASKVAGTGAGFLFNFASRRFIIFGRIPESLPPGADYLA